MKTIAILAQTKITLRIILEPEIPLIIIKKIRHPHLPRPDDYATEYKYHTEGGNDSIFKCTILASPLGRKHPFPTSRLQMDHFISGSTTTGYFALFRTQFVRSRATIAAAVAVYENNKFHLKQFCFFVFFPPTQTTETFFFVKKKKISYRVTVAGCRFANARIGSNVEISFFRRFFFFTSIFSFRSRIIHIALSRDTETC